MAGTVSTGKESPKLNKKVFEFDLRFFKTVCFFACVLICFSVARERARLALVVKLRTALFLFCFFSTLSSCLLSFVYLKVATFPKITCFASTKSDAAETYCFWVSVLFVYKTIVLLACFDSIIKTKKMSDNLFALLGYVVVVDFG